MAIDKIEVLPWTEYPSGWSLALKENYQDLATVSALLFDITKIDTIDLEKVSINNAPSSYSQEHSQKIVDSINQINKNQKLITDKINEIIKIAEANLINEEA